MRILYVTPLWSGLKDLLVDGRPAAGGMPAFVRPLQGLVAQGHQIDMIVATPRQDMRRHVGAPWLERVEVEMVPWQRQPRLDPVPWSRPLVDGPKRLSSTVRVVRAVRRALRRQRYDFVYGHGSLGAIGTMLAQRAGLPSGQRLYGVHDLLARLDRPAARAWLLASSPLLYLSFRTSKSFLLVTDDGSQGDAVWRRLGREGACRFYCWRNGVEFPVRPLPAADPATPPFLFMPARIAAWKGQHRALEVLRDLHALGHTEIGLVFAGSVTDPGYRARLDRLCADYGLGEKVRYLGSLPGAELIPFYRQSLATLALYETANLGNVVIEGMSTGSVLVVRDSAVLDGVITDGHNGLRVHTAEDAARGIAGLLEDPARARALAAAASSSARRLFRDWDARVEREIGLIEACGRGGRAAAGEEINAAGAA